MQLRYHGDDSDRAAPRPSTGTKRGARPFEPSVDREAIFRMLIHQELRHGRLHKSSRARIVRYACGMGLSAVRAGELVRECAEELARDGDAFERQFALRVLRDPGRSDQVPISLLAAIGVLTAVVAYVLYLRVF